jgi:type I restriction enzyme, S subunit
MGKYQGYEKYKESGVEWLGDIPEHWEVKKLKHIGKSIIGIIYHPTEVVQGNGVLVLRSSNIQDRKLCLEDCVFIDKDIPKNLRLKIGDILICSRNGSRALIGKNITIDEETEGQTFGAFMTVFRTELYSFISKYFNSQVFNGQSGLFLTSTINQLTIGTINNFFVALPPIDEQESIAYFLDRKTPQIDALIAKKAALLEKLDEKRTALISHAVTKGLNSSVPMKDSGVEWLGDIPEHWDCLSLRLRYSIELGKMLDQRKISGDYLVKYLRNVDVQWDFINQDELPEMDINPREYERYLVKEGDLLVCEGGESGRSAIVQSTENIIGFQKAIHRLRPIDKQEISRYLLYTFYYVSKLGVFIAEGNPNTITHLTSEKLKLYKLPRPSRIEQELIVEYLDQKTAEIDLQKVKVKEAIELLKEYRTALITNAVTGKIDVRQVAI